MKLIPCFSRSSGGRRGGRAAAFTLMEMLFATVIGIFVLGSFAVFTSMATSAIKHIYAQNLMAVKGGRAEALLLSRVRQATYMAVDTNNVTLTLGFDDQPTNDVSLLTFSNNDGNKYNDVNHYEQFKILSGDGSFSTTNDNSLLYIADTAASNVVVVLLTNNVRKLPNLPVFQAVNNTLGATVGYAGNGTVIISGPPKTNTTVIFNIGMVDRAGGKRTQAIELRTQAVRRN